MISIPSGLSQNWEFVCSELEQLEQKIDHGDHGKLDYKEHSLRAIDVIKDTPLGHLVYLEKGENLSVFGINDLYSLKDAVESWKKYLIMPENKGFKIVDKIISFIRRHKKAVGLCFAGGIISAPLISYLYSDPDCDGLKTYEEIFISHTNPHSADEGGILTVSEALEHSPEQFFVSSNPKLRQDLQSDGNTTYCYVIGHAGYSTYHVNAPENFKKYGNYPQYLKNITTLIKHLESLGNLTVFAVEEYDFCKKDIPKNNLLRPFNPSFIIVTKNGYGTFKKCVKTSYGIFIQRPDLMYSFLEKNGIKEVRFGGEWGWYQGKGCLGHIAAGFHNRGFDIKGVEGCIYPSRDPKRMNDEVIRELYEDTVPFDSLIIGEQ